MASITSHQAAPPRDRRVRWGVRGCTVVAAFGLALAAGSPASASPNTPADTTAAVNGTVFAIVHAGDRTFIGGEFTTVGGRPRLNAAALLADGTLDLSWQPNPDGIVRAITASADGSRVFLGGEFLNAGGAARSKLAAVDGATGTAIADWVANANNDVLALTTRGSRVYAGGRFTEIGGQALRRLVAIDATTGVVNTTFRPNPDWTVRGVAASPDGTKVYPVGGFANIRGGARPGAAEVNSVDGTVTAFNPVISNGGVVLAVALTPDGSRLFICTESNRIFAYAPATSSAALYNVQTSGDTQAMAASDTELYFGGHFNRLNGFQLDRQHMASIYVATGTPTGWNPQVDGYMGVWAVAIGPNYVAIGGDFYNVGGGWQRGFARFTGTP